MPIYEYRREDGTTFEIMQSMSDAPLTHDPETGQAVTRVLHAPAVHFKGSGFYNTDYGTAKRKREMDKSASDGADKHDAKQKDKGKSSDSSSSGGGSGSSSSSGDSSSSSSSSSGSSSSGDKGGGSGSSSSAAA
jgi:putative FmdB family regulatory protein